MMESCDITPGRFINDSCDQCGHMLAVHYPLGCGIKTGICGVCEIREEMAPYLNFRSVEGLKLIVGDLE